MSESSVPRNATSSVPSGSWNVSAAYWVCCEMSKRSSAALMRVTANRGLRLIER